MGNGVLRGSDAKQWRRMRAWQLSRQGWKQRDIALVLDVSEGAVSQWLAAGRQAGEAALMTQSGRGRPGRLTAEQMRLIPDFLGHGPEAYGFRGQVWTTGRVGQVIQQEFGVRYHRGHVSRLLKQLHWTPQVPVIRALQRDEDEIQRWRLRVWPHLRRQASQEHRTVVLTDESGFYLLPGVVKTYAPRGVSPVLGEWQTRDHLSVMGGITCQAKIYSLVRQESFNGLHTVEFLRHLVRYLGPRMLVIWDGSPIHRRTEVAAFLGSRDGRGIRIEPLPAYAPDLNPVEGVWQHLKHVEMRNIVCLDLEELHLQLHLAIARLRQKPHLVRSFFQGAGLKV